MTSDVPSPQHHYCSLLCLGEHRFWFHQLTTDQKCLSFMLHKNIKIFSVIFIYIVCCILLIVSSYT